MKIIITAIFLLVASSLASAVCLKGHRTIAEEYANSKTVFIGKVTAKEEVPKSGDFYDGHDYSVQAQEVFKGNPINPIVIFSENSSGRFPMEVGMTYIIFLYYELGRYQIDNCGNSGLLSEKQDVVQAVRQLKQIRGKQIKKPIEALYGFARNCRPMRRVVMWLRLPSLN